VLAPRWERLQAPPLTKKDFRAGLRFIEKDETMNVTKWLSVLTLAMAVIGCGPTPPPADQAKIKAPPKKDDHDDHDHGPGPHQGTVFDFSKYHAEFCVDHGKKEVTVYILSGNLKKAVPIPVEKLLLSIKTPQFQVEMKAAPLDGEPKGHSSRFTVTHDHFGKEQEFAGTLSGEIDGKPCLGDFQEQPHDHDAKDKK
jgi:hypothetical protein